MSKGYLKKLLKYMKEVYHIEDDIKHLKDRRIKPKYSAAEAILPVLFGFLIRIQSFNELKFRLKSKDFKNVISRKMKLPQIDTVRDTLKVVDNQRLSKMHNNIIKKAKQNKILRNGTIDGYTVAAIDGTKLFGSNKKSCIECCTTKTRNNHIHYFHNAAFMSLIGKEPRLIIDFEMYKGTEDSSKKDEGELTVAKRLLSKVAKEHKHTIDVVVYDALACNSVWINHCIKSKVIPVIHVKDNNVTSIKEVKTKINKGISKEGWHDHKRDCDVKAYEESFRMDDVETRLRFVKFSKKSGEGRYSQVLVITSNFDIPLQTLYKMMHMRWDIENSIFNKLKTYCALEHCFVHDMNAIQAILYLMSTASNLIQLFVCRRLKNYVRKQFTQKEIIRLLTKELYLLKYDTKYIFNTT